MNTNTNVIFLGHAIRQKRRAMHLSQEKLCQGICDPVTISRLETGKQTPTYHKLRSLLDRLDMPMDRFYCLVTVQDINISELTRKIVENNVQIDKAPPSEHPKLRQRGMDLIAQLEKVIDDIDPVNRQLIQRSKVILGTEEGPYPLDVQMQMLLDAIRITSPDFRLDRIADGLYTTEEIKIINQIANVFSERGELELSLELFGQLYDYIRRSYRAISPIRSCFILVCYNYASELLLAKQYQKAIEVADEGRRLSLLYDSNLYLPGLLSHMAEAHHFLGNDALSRSLYTQSYYTLVATADFQNAAVIQKEAREYLGLELSY